MYGLFKGFLYASLRLSQQKHQDEAQSRGIGQLLSKPQLRVRGSHEVTVCTLSPPPPQLPISLWPLRVRIGRTCSKTFLLSPLCSSKQSCEHYVLESEPATRNRPFCSMLYALPCQTRPPHPPCGQDVLLSATTKCIIPDFLEGSIYSAWVSTPVGTSWDHSPNN